MYELINTSVPNGLIPGSHGFSTVALTQGVGEGMRMRLEAYCAYKHRASANDESYNRENPVNWFHVIMPSGEHVLGRVGASPFDYTGRTNRLAHLLAIHDRQLNGIAATDVLEQEELRLAAPWSGEPRYLEPLEGIFGQLRNDIFNTSAGTPNWDACFGVELHALAQRVAWQLAANMAAGGRTLYFKLNAAQDPTGVWLRTLFGEIIHLLPLGQRAKVTFSTYAAALPEGTICHLRGIFDDDRGFANVCATDAWIDVEHRRVVHPEALPTCDPLAASRPPESAVSVQSSSPSAMSSSPNAMVGRSRLTVVPQQSATRCVSPSSLIPPSQSGGGLKTLLALIVVMAIVGLGLLAWRWAKPVPKPKEPVPEPTKTASREKPVAAAVPTNTVSAIVQSKPGAGSGDAAKVEKPSVQRKAPSARQSPDADYAEQARRRADKVSAQSKAETKKLPDEDLFQAATVRRPGRPDPAKDAGCFTTNDGCRVYYYDSAGRWTSEVAGVVSTKNPLTGKPISQLQYGNRLNSPGVQVTGYKTKRGFVVWYNPAKKIAWIDCGHNPYLGEEDALAATEIDRLCREKPLDLQQLVFGSNPRLVEAYKKLKGWKQLGYRISIWGPLPNLPDDDAKAEPQQGTRKGETTEFGCLDLDRGCLTVDRVIKVVQDKLIKIHTDNIRAAADPKSAECRKLEKEIADIKKKIEVLDVNWKICDPTSKDPCALKIRNQAKERLEKCGMTQINQSEYDMLLKSLEAEFSKKCKALNDLRDPRQVDERINEMKRKIAGMHIDLTGYDIKVRVQGK